jgi:hypothetical protein
MIKETIKGLKKGQKKAPRNSFKIGTNIQVVIFKREVTIWLHGGTLQFSIRRTLVDRLIGQYQQFKKAEHLAH